MNVSETVTIGISLDGREYY